MKFGGTSVADIDRIRNVARHVKREVDAGHEVAVVVSAMAGKTNELVAWCTQASPLHDAREYDVVVASGEQVTSGLLAITLQSMGVSARSWRAAPIGSSSNSRNDATPFCRSWSFSVIFAMSQASPGTTPRANRNLYGPRTRPRVPSLRGPPRAAFSA